MGIYILPSLTYASFRPIQGVPQRCEMKQEQVILDTTVARNANSVLTVLLTNCISKRTSTIVFIYHYRLSLKKKI